MCYKGIFAELLCCFSSSDHDHDPHHGGGQHWHQVPNNNNNNIPLANQQQPQPPNNVFPGRPCRTRPNAGPWETLRAEQVRGGGTVPQTYDYAKGPRPDGTRTWQANWEGRQTAEFGAAGAGKGVV